MSGIYWAYSDTRIGFVCYSLLAFFVYLCAMARYYEFVEIAERILNKDDKITLQAAVRL